VGDDPCCAGIDHALLTGGPRIEVGGTAISVPAPPEQILVLAVHLLSDRDRRLIWVQDLALAGRRATEAEWHRTFELARRLGLPWVLHRALDYAGHHLDFARHRPAPTGPAPPWGPLRAVEELDMRAATHVGRLATLDWPGRGRYLRQVLFPTREGLAGTVGRDGAPTWRLIGRHLRAVFLGLAPGQR
jgi:hypothetical protein